MYSFPIFLLFLDHVLKNEFQRGRRVTLCLRPHGPNLNWSVSPVTFFLTFVIQWGSRYVSGRMDQIWINLSPVNDLFSWPFVIQGVTGTCPIPVLKQHIWFSYVMIRGLVSYYPQTLNYLLQIIAILFTEHTASTIGWFWLCSYHDSGAPNDGFLPNTMNTLFRLYRVPLHL